jgi:hypothetical protein
VLLPASSYNRTVKPEHHNGYLFKSAPANGIPAEQLIDRSLFPGEWNVPLRMPGGLSYGTRYGEARAIARDNGE